jgi:soluble lytic murein transglycosylase-like protein
MKTALMSYSVASDSYWNIAWQAAVNAGINPQLFENQIQQESGFNPGAVSPAGAEGIAQFMPATAASMGVNPWDPTSSLYGAANLMAQLSRQFGGNYAMALAAYNAGPGAVQYAINAGGNSWYYYLPTETRNYVSIIMGW